VKDIHVRFAGVEKAPDSEQLSIIYIPDNRQILLPGRRYRIVIEGLSFEKWEGKQRSEAER